MLIVGIILVVLLIVVKSKLKDANEACGRNICPRCHSKMEMGSISGRYHCPKCNWKQGAGYF